MLTQCQVLGGDLCLPVADITTWVEPESGWAGERVRLAAVDTAVEAAAVAVVRVEAVSFTNAEVHCNTTTQISVLNKLSITIKAREETY